MGTYYYMGAEFQFCKVKSVLEMDSCDDLKTIQMHLILWNCTLNLVMMVL